MNGNFFRLVSFSISILFVLNILRQQVSEISLLQLVPGFYIGLIFFLFVLCFSFTEWFFNQIIQYDNQKGWGTKTADKMFYHGRMKFRIFLFIGGSFFLVTTLLPISLDSFSSFGFGEKTVENLWSFEDLNAVETVLSFVSTFLFQIPFFFTLSTYSLSNSKFFLSYFKNYSFFVCLFAGIITPTVDIPTQLNFIFIGIGLYLVIFSMVQKETNYNPYKIIAK
uniref:Sec-independent translocase component C n=1 Tax=Mallomonas splendens TaxID=52552 RepID=A0A3G2QZU4_9STRA|nr:Sec-independent translocase component C [Mallomonas splendens]AYO28492.1 Sec-independent translocase component C [Mallomonas splendens]